MPSLNTKLASAPNTTANYVLKATSSTTIGNSLIQDASSYIDVAGYAYFRRGGKYLILNPNVGSANEFIDIGSDAGMGMKFSPTGTTALTLASTGAATFSSSVDATIFNSTSNAFRLNGNNALTLTTLGGQSLVKINAAGFWGTQLVGANDQGIVINNTGNVLVGSYTSKWPTIKSVELNAAEVIYGMANGSTALGYMYHNGTNLYLSNERTGVSGVIVFNNDGAEKMRITNGADVWINTTGNYGTSTLSVRSAWSAGSYGQVQFYTGTGNATIRSSVPGNSTNGMQILTYSSGTGDKITANFDGFGNVYNYNNSSTWQQTSDIRVKENIRPINNALDKINSLNPTHFEYKNKLGKTKTGFIAQEFEHIFPGHTLETAPPDDLKEYFAEGEMMKSIDADLIPYLVKAIQEQQDIITELTDKVNRLYTNHYGE